MGSTPEDPRIGVVLNGRYRITHRLGEGGMGVVYRGERVELNRPVAIKFLHSPYAKSQKFVSRFQREARAMSRLSHPCCVSVIDFGVHDAPYIVMDFVTGATLRDVLDDGRVPAARGVQIVRQILSGLAHAHGQGVIHRDIKPGNIMLGEAAGMGDHVRIFDFGLAKLHDPGFEGEPSMVGIVGTPCYMAPEQTRGDKVDARADLYATGIVLFEMLTGQKPFDGEDSVSILRMQRERAAPKLRALAPDLSPELEAVVARALEKDLMKRFQTAAEFLDALEATPEATGRASAAVPQKKDNSEDPVAYAETQQVTSPRVERTTSDHAALLESTARRDRSRSSSSFTRRAIWVLGFGVLLGVVVWRFYGFGAASELSRRDQPLPDGPAQPGPADAPPAQAPAEPDPSAVVPGAPSPEAGSVAAAQPDAAPSVATADAAAPAGDDLSAAQLAAADLELEQESTESAAAPEPVVADTGSERVKSLADVKALIDAGQIDPAIAGIRRLRRQDKDNPQLPYLLGELYFKRGWWSDGLAKYREAIRMRSSYRERATIQKNAIEALGADKTYARARALIVRDIGRTIGPRLRVAARSNPSETVRRRAKSILRQLF
jgi:serine/threonine protein kinase